MKTITFTAILVALGAIGASAQVPTKGPVPQVTGYDFEGNKFPLADKLKGHYSVVVFGCLT